jgi:hypothetical protein
MNSTVFSLRVNGKTLVLPADMRLQMVLRSPFFHKVGEFGYSFPFNLPIAPNAATLNYPDRYGVPDEAFDCELYIYGNLYKKGLLYLEAIEEELIQAYLKVDVLLPEDKLHKKIHQLGVLPNITFDSESSLINHMNAKVNAADYVFFPLHNDKLRDHLAKILPTVRNLTVTPIINYYSNNSFRRVWERMLHEHPVTGDDTNINRTDLVITPFVKLMHFMDQVFDSYGLPFQFTNLLASGYERLVIYNNVLADKGMYRSYDEQEPHLDLNKHLPDISLEDFLDQSNDFLSGSFLIKNGKSKYVFWEELLRETDYIDLSDQLLRIEKITPKAKEEQIHSFTYQAPSGDNSWDLIKDLDNARLKGSRMSYELLPPNPQLYDSYYVHERHAYMVYQPSNPSGTSLDQWELYSVNLYGIPHGSVSAEFDYTITTSPVINYPHLVPLVFYTSPSVQGVTYTQMKVPVAHQELASIHLPGTDSTEDLRFLLYHGLQNGIPYASHHNIDPDGNTLSNFSLDMNAKDSLYYKNRRNWNDFLNHSMELQLSLKLSWLDIETLDFSKRYRIAGQDFFFKELEFDIDALGISTVTATVQQIAGNTIKTPPTTHSYTYYN